MSKTESVLADFVRHKNIKAFGGSFGISGRDKRYIVVDGKKGNMSIYLTQKDYKNGKTPKYDFVLAEHFVEVKKK